MDFSTHQSSSVGNEYVLMLKINDQIWGQAVIGQSFIERQECGLFALPFIHIVLKATGLKELIGDQ
ncbi:MAG: hypothetical protein AAGF54_17460 [Pseudomonadota bacterium]